MDEQERFRQLFDDTYRPLLAYALRRVPDPADAEDIVAETLTVAWRRRSELPPDEEGRAYVFGIARKVLANHHRGRRRWLRALARQATEPDRTMPPSELPDPQIIAALDALSERDRQVLRLSAWDGLDIQAIAAVLEITPSGVSSRLHRARRRLAGELIRVRGKRATSVRDGT